MKQYIFTWAVFSFGKYKDRLIFLVLYCLCLRFIDHDQRFFTAMYVKRGLYEQRSYRRIQFREACKKCTHRCWPLISLLSDYSPEAGERQGSDQQSFAILSLQVHPGHGEPVAEWDATWTGPRDSTFEWRPRSKQAGESQPTPQRVLRQREHGREEWKWAQRGRTGSNLESGVLVGIRDLFFLF